MSTSKIKEILNYKELNPKIGYYELSITFNLSIDELLKLLVIPNYYINNFNSLVFNDSKGNETYKEWIRGNWEKYERDSNGNVIYYEHSDGYWEKYDYDKNNKQIYYENSDGKWKKYKYDNNNNNNIIYREYCNVFWDDWLTNRFGISILTK